MNTGEPFDPVDYFLCLGIALTEGEETELLAHMSAAGEALEVLSFASEADTRFSGQARGEIHALDRRSRSHDHQLQGQASRAVIGPRPVHALPG